MRISRKKRPQKPTLRFRMNEAIKVPKLRVVNHKGDFLGIMTTDEARELAHKQEMDLIEIVPKGEIHVAKITDYGKFKYRIDKEERKQKSQQKKIGLKGIRLSLRIGKHDIDLRTRRAIKFLEEGDKIKIELILKGRERGRPNLGRDVVSNFVKELGTKTAIKIEQPISRQGSKFFAVITSDQKVKEPLVNKLQ
tara:strand:- start:269 stop:850 length:582 start_codon:yes stop_codon:yes gene_type:complete